ncbi:MAG: alpha/beta fold hydrolase [Sphingomonadales bacterium]
MNPRVIFLPGAGADPEFWRPVGNRLPPGAGKLYLGWPGLGNQAPSDTVAGFADLVALVRGAIGDGPCDLVAQSMGGAIALQVALDVPDKVRRIVLTGTSGGIDAAALGGADWRPDYRRDYPDARLSLLADWPDLGARLHQIRQPVLLLWGGSDPISPLAVAARLATLLPDTHTVVIPGGDHAFAVDRAAEAARAIEAFLA